MSLNETQEIWIQLNEPFSNYEVSNQGRIRNKNTRHILRGSCVGKYKQVALGNIDNRKFIYVHRLVAEAFFGTPENPDWVVHHKNHNPSDNHAENLEWCSAQENAKLKKPAVSTDNRSRPVIQKTMDGEIVAVHTRITQIGYDTSSIVKVCKGKQNSAYGFKWEYADEPTLEDEQWKELSLADTGLISASSKGRIKLPSGKVAIGSLNDRGYRKVALIIYGKKRQQLVHRLIAMAFLPLPDGSKNFDDFEVDHKNSDRADNSVENLEWVTSRENLSRARKNRTASPDNYRKPVVAISMIDGARVEFRSILTASKALGIQRKTIDKIASGNQKVTKDQRYRFEFLVEEVCAEL